MAAILCTSFLWLHHWESMLWFSYFLMFNWWWHYEGCIHTHTVADTLGVDAYMWQWMYTLYTLFGDVSAILCDASASVAPCPSAIIVDSAMLMPLVACQLFPLNKCPPNWNWKCPLSSYFQGNLFSVGDDVVSAVDPLPTCAGHVAGSNTVVIAGGKANMLA